MIATIVFTVGVIGVFYGGGLWWTLQHLPVARNCEHSIFSSWRLGITLLAWSLMLSDKSMYEIIPIVICCGFLAMEITTILLIQARPRISI